MRYASQTLVSSEKSKAEVEKTLTRYGATQFMSGWKEGIAMVGFVMNQKQIRFVLPMPDKNSEEFRFKYDGRSREKKERSPEAAYGAWEQATRQRWRALALVVKAKLEAVESGIATFEEEFLAHIVLPNGQTAGQMMLPRIDKAYKTGEMPALGWEGK